MPNKEENKRKRIVVEEVKADESAEPKVEAKKEIKVLDTVPEPKILDEAAKDSISPEPVKDVEPIKVKKTPSIALWIIIPGIFLLGAILGGIVFYQRGVNSSDTEITTPTAIPTSTPGATASPSATIDLTKYTISIFNGSGIAGEASKAKTLLTEKGFKIGTTANAATYDYTKTIIKAKSTVEPAFVTALSTTLGKTYVVDATQTLSTSSAESIQIVIGSSKAE